MFTPSDFKIMERKCPNERDKLLKLLGIKDALPFAENDFKAYEKLDIKIEKTLAAKLNSSSVVEGYAKIFDTGGIAFSLSETSTELLAKILANSDKILKSAPAQVGDNNSSSDSSPSLWARFIEWFKNLFGSGESKKSAPRQSKKLSRKQIEEVLPILKQISKIFKAI